MIAQADAIQIPLADKSVHCAVTSPPYWGLRKYAGDQGRIWGGDPECEHEWIERRYYTMRGASSETAEAFSEPGKGNSERLKNARWRQDSICECGAWYGSLGLEPTPEQHVENIVEICREVRRVLRDDGVFWLDYGAMYWSSSARSSARQELRGNVDQSGHQGIADVPRVFSYGNDGRELQDWLDLDFAYRDLCDECLADYLNHRRHIQHRDQPHGQSEQRAEQKGRDSAPLDSSTSLGASPLGAQESTTLRSWQQLRGECSRCANRASALSEIGLSSPDVQDFSAALRMIRSKQPAETSSSRTKGRELFSKAWAYYTSTLRAGDIVALPWMIAISLQADGWILRNDVIWARPNPMPESVNGWRWQRERTRTGEDPRRDDEYPMPGKPTQRSHDGQDFAQPEYEYGDDLELRKGSWRHTRAHEYVFMLVKGMQYWSNQEAVREAHKAKPWGKRKEQGKIDNSRNDSEAFTPDFDPSSSRFYNSSGRNPRSVLDATELRRYELPDGTICIVSEDCPVHGQHQDGQIQQMELDGEQAAFPLSRNEGIDDHDQEPASELLSSSDHSNQERHLPKKDSQSHENESARNPESIVGNKTVASHSDAYDEDAQILSDNENTQELSTCPSEEEPLDSGDPVAIDPNRRHHKKNALSDEPDTASGPKVLPHIDRNESACSCRWIIPRAHYAPSVLDVPTAPYRAAHYATYPPNLIAPLIRATCPRWACPVCGQGWAAVVDRELQGPGHENYQLAKSRAAAGKAEIKGRSEGWWPNHSYSANVLGYRPTCDHPHTQEEAVPGVVFDPFVGSGTTVAVAQQLLRRGIGIDVSMEYLDQQAKLRIGLGTPKGALEDLPLFQMDLGDQDD